MDANDIFRKLSSGTSFKKKTKVLNDSHKPKIEPQEINIPPIKKRKIKTNKFSGIETGSSLKLLDELVANSFTTCQSNSKSKTDLDLTNIEKERISALRNKYRISVIGKNVTPPVERFEDFPEKLKLSSIIMKNILSLGFDAPTPIQMQTIPVMLEGRQVLACAPTGSGKTAAFLVPLIHHLQAPKKGGFRAVIVCPTRELAAQSFRECLRLSAGTGLRALVISKISHDSDDKFNKKATNNYDILFTTPNRLVYLLQKEPPILTLKKTEWLVIDECDKLFEAGVRGFRDQLAVIYSACESATVKRAMFSATQYPPLTKWCRKHLKALITINIGVRNTSCQDVEQELLFVGSEAGKLVAIRDIISKGLTPPVLIFVQSKGRAQELFNELLYDGINVDVIHSDRTQTQRENVIRSFREGKIWVLICTELMGRGIDFLGVNLVVNYDFPPSTVAYIHRVGRTGRAGRKGKAITFFTLEDKINLRSIATVIKEAGGNIPEYILSQKKPSKREKKDLERRAPLRESISTSSIYQEMLERKKKNAIKRSKRKNKSKALTADNME